MTGFDIESVYSCFPKDSGIHFLHKPSRRRFSRSIGRLGMNFLAHLHCSPNQELVRVFNLLVTIFRGNHWKSHATDAMIIGVELHRFIDSYTDNNPLSKIAKQTIRSKAGKTAPIVLDLLGDYFLHKHWKSMSGMKNKTLNVDINDFIETCSKQISRNTHLLQGKSIKHVAPYEQGKLANELFIHPRN